MSGTRVAGSRRRTHPERRRRVGFGPVPLALALLLTGCAGQPAPLPTIGSPSPTPTEVAFAAERPALLARRWDLTGAPLPADWPDVPVPTGTEVVTAYGIGSEPRRTWTATFSADRGTALDLAEPVVTELRKRGYIPIAEYVGAASTNTGLYSFAAPSFAVYVVLGEDDGRPNVVMTIRGSTDPMSELGASGSPAATPPAASTSASPSSPGPGSSEPTSASPTTSPAPGS